MHHRSVTPLTLMLSAIVTLSACSLSTSSPSASSTPSVSPTVGGTGAPGAAPSAAGAAVPTHPHQNSSDAPDWGVGSQGQQAAEGSTLTVADVRVGKLRDRKSVV